LLNDVLESNLPVFMYNLLRAYKNRSIVQINYFGKTLIGSSKPLQIDTRSFQMRQKSKPLIGSVMQRYNWIPALLKTAKNKRSLIRSVIQRQKWIPALLTTAKNKRSLILVFFLIKILSYYFVPFSIENNRMFLITFFNFIRNIKLLFFSIICSFVKL